MQLNRTASASRELAFNHFNMASLYRSNLALIASDKAWHRAMFFYHMRESQYWTKRGGNLVLV